METGTESPAVDRGELDAIGALAEPHRRALYEFVAHQPDWVGREQAADAVGIQRGVAAHHLDRLADEGLLEVDYQRLTGRSGPGAGRPAKVYRRARAEIGVTLPPRHYALAGRLLADGAERARREGVAIDVAIDDAARDEGRALGGAARADLDGRAGVAARRRHLFEVLRKQGFEPELRDDEVTVLRNCPFHQLAQRHTELICGMNLCLLEGMLDELRGTGLRAVLDPEDGACCVQFRPATGL